MRRQRLIGCWRWGGGWALDCLMEEVKEENFLEES